MSQRTIKLSFRRKPGDCAVKVYVTVRLWQDCGPKQLHLGYVPPGNRISAADKRRLEKRLRNKWRQQFSSAGVAVDWVATQQKWREREQPEKRGADRDAARKQLRRWQSGAKEKLLPQFGGPKRQTSELAGGEFHLMFRQSHQGIVKRLSNSGRSVDPALVATWWEEHEAPRLLCGFHRLVARRTALRFGRAGFLRYLAGNIARGFAVAQFLRENPNPLLSPLTDGASARSGAPEMEW